jgi:hypothetical protein
MYGTEDVELYTCMKYGATGEGLMMKVSTHIK